MVSVASKMRAMTKTKFDYPKRFAIFTVHGEKCWLCNELMSLSEVEIDHIIPESWSERPELPAILKSLGCPENFDLNGWANLRPAHGRCNRRKSSHVFRPSPLIQLELEIGLKKAPEVEEAMNGVLSDRKLEKAIALILGAAEAGKLGQSRIQKIAQLVSSKSEPYREPERKGKPFSVAPHLEVIKEEADRYWLKGPSGMMGYRPKNAADFSWDCPNCGPTGWNGTRCISCGHLVDPD